VRERERGSEGAFSVSNAAEMAGLMLLLLPCCD